MWSHLIAAKIHVLALSACPPCVHSYVQVEGVQDVHDLHVWSLSSSIPILTAHVHIGMDAEPDRVR